MGRAVTNGGLWGRCGCEGGIEWDGMGWGEGHGKWIYGQANREKEGRKEGRAN